MVELALAESRAVIRAEPGRADLRDQRRLDLRQRRHRRLEHERRGRGDAAARGRRRLGTPVARRDHAQSGTSPAIVIADSFGRPWRLGQADIAIGCAGLVAVADWRGRADAAGRELAATEIAIADQLAAAADLTRDKDSGAPGAVISGLGDLVTADDGPGAKAVQRPADHDRQRRPSLPGGALAFLARAFRPSASSGSRSLPLPPRLSLPSASCLQSQRLRGLVHIRRCRRTWTIVTGTNGELVEDRVGALKIALCCPIGTASRAARRNARRLALVELEDVVAHQADVVAVGVEDAEDVVEGGRVQVREADEGVRGPVADEDVLLHRVGLLPAEEIAAGADARILLVLGRVGGAAEADVGLVVGS